MAGKADILNYMQKENVAAFYRCELSGCTLPRKGDPAQQVTGRYISPTTS